MVKVNVVKVNVVSDLLAYNRISFIIHFPAFLHLRYSSHTS